MLTADDLAERVRPLPVPASNVAEIAPEPHPILASGEVRYVGQPVAAVIADSRELAEDGAERVEVDYSLREPVMDARGSNRPLMRWSRTSGDVDGAFACADHVVRGRYALPRLVAAPIETRGCVVAHEPDADMLTVWCSAQDPHRPLAQLAHALIRPSDSIRVIVPDVGGAFGGKGVIAPEIVAVAAAAVVVRRPVKWVEDRLENFLAAYQGRGIEGDLELALDATGRMLAIRAHLCADLGAYLFGTTPIPPTTAATLITGCYDIPAAQATILGARTNRVPTGPYRGAGRPDAAYMLERLVDDAARAIGIDRIELRRRNLIRGFPHRTALGLVYDSGDFERCLDLALELGELDDGVNGEPGHIAGTGVGMFVERAGGQWESAAVEVELGGTVVVRSSSSPHGQGHETTFAQIAATRLGVDPGDIALRFGDSAESPPGVGTFGSRSVAMAGSAVLVAVDELIEEGRLVIADRLGVQPEAVGFEHGRFSAEGRKVAIAELTGLKASARFESDLVFSSGAYVARVEIDCATGRLHVRRLAAVDDAGIVINPLLAHGQVVGGVAQGLGECLVEEATWDEEGRPRFSSLMNYSLLTAAEIPPIVTGEVTSPSPLNPLGAKGIGEGGAIGTLPAVSNAVVDALGGFHVDPPFTDEKLWRAIHRDRA